MRTGTAPARSALRSKLPAELGTLAARIDEPHARADVFEHLCVIDLFARYLLFVPLCYYLDLLAKTARPGKLLDAKVCNGILDALGVRGGRAGSGGLTPNSCIERAAQIVDLLAGTRPHDPLVEELSSLHRRHFSMVGPRGERTGLSEEVRRIFKIQRDDICHVHATMNDITKRQVCDSWRSYFHRWLDSPLFDRLDLTVATPGGGRISLHHSHSLRAAFVPGTEAFSYAPEDADSIVTFHAYPFLRISPSTHSLQVLTAYRENARVEGEIRYTECEPVAPSDGEPISLEGQTLKERIAFPWVRVECQRTLAAERLVVGRTARMTLRFANSGSEVATVQAFRDELPDGIRCGGVSAIEVPTTDVSPGSDVELAFAIEAEDSASETSYFRTREVIVRQGPISGRVPVRGTLEFGVCAAQPANLTFNRVVQRWDEQRLAAVTETEPFATGELINVRVRIENPGRDYERLVYEESIPSSCRFVGESRLEGAPPDARVETHRAAGRRAITCSMSRPFSYGGTLTLEYSLVALHPGRVTLRGRTPTAMLGPGDNAPKETAPTRLRIVKEAGPPHIDVTVVAATPAPQGEALALLVETANRSRQVVYEPALMVRGQHHTDLCIPIGRLLRGSERVTTTLQIGTDHGPLRRFAADLTYRDFTNQSRRERDRIRISHLHRVWRSPDALRDAHGREEVVADLLDELFERERGRPVFLQGADGTGKAHLLRSLPSMASVLGTGSLWIEERVSCYGAGSENEQIRHLLRTLAERADPRTSDATDGITAGLRALKLDAGPIHGLLDKFLADGSRRQLGESAADVLVRFLLEFRRMRAASQGSDDLRLIIVIGDASALEPSAVKTLNAAQARLRAKGIGFVLVDPVRPDLLADLVHTVTVGPWSEDQFTAFCDKCFLYPRLHSDDVVWLAKRSGRHPGLTTVALRFIQGLDTREFTVDEGTVRLTATARERVDAVIENEFDEEFARLLHRLPSEMHGMVHTAVALVNAAEGLIEEGAVLKLLHNLSDDTQLRLRKPSLDALTREGWIRRERSLRYAAALSGARRHWAQTRFEDRKMLFDQLLAHFTERGEWHAILYLDGASDTAVVKHAPALVGRALEALEHADYDHAFTYFDVLAKQRPRLPAALRFTVSRGRARAEWKLRRQATAGTWLEGFDHGLAASDRKLLEADRSLFDAAVTADHADALERLDAYLCESTPWRRLRPFPRTSNVIHAAFDHHLLALERAFFGLQSDRFLRLNGRIDKALPRLSWSERVEYIEALLRLADDERCEGVLLATTPPPYEVLDGQIATPPSPLQDVVDANVLAERCLAFYDAQHESPPFWLVRMRFHAWKRRWDERHRAHSPERSAALLSDIDQIVATLQDIAPGELLARALSARADVLWESPGREQDAADTYRRAAAEYEEFGEELRSARALVSAARCRLSKITVDELREAAPQVQKDIAQALRCGRLTEAERSELMELRLDVASVAGRDALDVLIAEVGASAPSGRLAYVVHRQQAEKLIAAKTSAADAEALVHVGKALELLDTIKATPQGPAAAWRPRKGMDAAAERTALLGRSAELCLRSHRYQDALRHIARVLADISERLHRERWDDPEYWGAVLAGGAPSPEAVFSELQAWTFLIWERDATSLRDRNRFIRQYVVKHLARAAARNSGEAAATASRVIARCWSQYKRRIPDALTKLEQIDLLLLRAEVEMSLGKVASEPIIEATGLMAALDIEREGVINYLVEILDRLLGATLERGLPYHTLLSGYRAILTRRRFVRAAESLIARALETYRRISGPASAPDASYPHEFMHEALTILNALQEPRLAVQTLNDLMRLNLLVPGFRPNALRCLERLGEMIRDEHNVETFHNTISMLCMMLAECRERREKRAAARKDSEGRLLDASDVDDEALWQRGLAVCHELVEESRRDDSWLGPGERRGLLFDLAEKLAAEKSVGLGLVAGLVLYKSSGSVRSSSLKMVAHAWHESARDDPFSDAHRIGLILALTEYWQGFEDDAPPLSDDDAHIWNTLLRGRSARQILQILALNWARNDREARERAFLATLWFEVHKTTMLWGTQAAHLILGEWGRPAEYSQPIQLFVLKVLTQELCRVESESATEQYRALKHYAERHAGDDWQKRVMERVLERWPAAPPHTSPVVMRLVREHIEALGLQVMEECAGYVASASIEDVLDAADRFLVHGVDPGYIEPPALPMGHVLSQYWAFVSSQAEMLTRA